MGVVGRHPYAAAAAAAFLGWRAVRRARAFDLRAKVVLVTGGSRGLGLLISRELARQGSRIVLCARDPAELAHARADLVPRGAQTVLALPCDVQQRSEVERVVDEATRQLGRIDVLVNNAGLIQVGPLDTMSIEDFEQAMATNFWGTVNATLAVLPQMRARGAGRIVNITSIGGRVAVPHLLPYDCAKFAALGFSEGLHAELAADGIVVTTVIPGLIRTGGHRHAFFKGQREAEYRWFAGGDTLPVFSMSAKRAARRIVEACRAGEAVLTLGWQAKMLRLVHALLPGFTGDVLGLVNRALPSSNGGGHLALRGGTLAP